MPAQCHSLQAARDFGYIGDEEDYSAVIARLRDKLQLVKQADDVMRQTAAVRGISMEESVRLDQWILEQCPTAGPANTQLGASTPVTGRKRGAEEDAAEIKTAKQNKKKAREKEKRQQQQLKETDRATQPPAGPAAAPPPPPSAEGTKIVLPKTIEDLRGWVNDDGKINHIRFNNFTHFNRAKQLDKAVREWGGGVHKDKRCYLGLLFDPSWLNGQQCTRVGCGVVHKQEDMLSLEDRRAIFTAALAEE